MHSILHVVDCKWDKTAAANPEENTKEDGKEPRNCSRFVVNDRHNHVVAVWTRDSSWIGAAVDRSMCSVNKGCGLVGWNRGHSRDSYNDWGGRHG